MNFYIAWEGLEVFTDMLIIGQLWCSLFMKSFVVYVIILTVIISDNWELNL